MAGGGSSRRHFCAAEATVRGDGDRSSARNFARAARCEAESRRCLESSPAAAAHGRGRSTSRHLPSRRTAAPQHRLASHSLRSLRSRSLTRQDENFHIIYTNAKVDLTEWHQFPVGRTHFNDDAVRRTGEWAGLWRWAGWGWGEGVVAVPPLWCSCRDGGAAAVSSPSGARTLLWSCEVDRGGGAVIFDRRRGASYWLHRDVVVVTRLILHHRPSSGNDRVWTT